MNKTKILLISSVVSLGGFLFGFDASVISGVIGFVSREYGLNEFQQGWVVSSPSFAAMFSMLVSGIISDKIGRKRVLQFAALLYAISAIFSAVAPNYEVLVIARMIGGIAFGAALILAPTYIGEVAPAELRGRLVSIQQLNIVLGFSISYFSNYLFLRAMNEGAFTELNVWRYMLGVEALPAMIYFFMLFFVPKSPRWLLYNGFNDKAEIVLKVLFGKERGQLEKQQIQEAISSKEAQKSKGLSFLFKKEFQLIIIIALTIGIVQQITGINAIFFYAATIFEQSGIGTNAAFSQAVLVGLTNLVFTILAITLIDKFGRKPLIIIGLIGVIFSMSLTSYSFSQATYRLEKQALVQLPESIDQAGLLPIIGVAYTNDVAFKKDIRKALGETDFLKYGNMLVTESTSMNAQMVLVGILLFVASFAFSLGPVMWVLFSEIFPANIRGVAVAFFGFINSLTSTFVQFIFPWELANLGNTLSYLSYAIFAVIGLFLIWKYLPETKGRSLEQLENELVR